jgi:signal transduction histidine kinase
MSIDLSDSNAPEADALSESRWIEEESVRRLMQQTPTMFIFAGVAMLVMTALTYCYVSYDLIFLWLALSALLLFYRFKLKDAFAKQVSTVDARRQSRLFKKYVFSSSLNAMAWGMTGWLFFLDFPIQNQYICSAILNMVAFITVYNIAPHRPTARAFINVLVGTQMVGAAWYIAAVKLFDGSMVQYFYLFGLLIPWVLLKIMDNQFYRNYHHDLILQFRNRKLIDSLNRQTKQLEHEKQVALGANATIKRFYSSAAHDIRQPVYALNVYSALLKDDPQQALTLIPKMTASCDAINALFGSLFDFEKIESGNIQLTVESVDIQQIFKDMEVIFRPMAKAKGLHMRMRPIAGSLRTDPVLIKGILSHLIMNAIKYTQQGGLLVAARRTAHGLSFEVWDTGIGIEPAHHAYIFDEFYKVGEPSSADEGFGLGLSVVKRLAAFIEGSSIAVQSQLGRGSVFKLQVQLGMYLESQNALQAFRNKR